MSSGSFKTVAQRIVDYRNTHPIKVDRPMPMDVFAKKTGLCKAMIHKIETGKVKNITWPTAEKLARVLKVKPIVLVTRGASSHE